MIHPEEYLEIISASFEENGNAEKAEWQRKYLRFKFDFYGLNAPEWVGLSKIIFKQHGLYSDEQLKEFVRLCFSESYRELHYVGLQMIEKNLKNQDAGFIGFLEELVQTNSWWDTVDRLSQLIRLHFERHMDLKRTNTEKWIESDNIWLKRVAIICQLTLRDKTNVEMLFDYILRVKDSKEFFIQKAAGWALRDYSRTDPEAVIAFIENNDLAALTKREGLKWLKRQNML